MREILKPLIKSRVVQLLARWTSVFLLSYAGWDAGKTNQYLDQTAEVVVAAIFVATDHVISRVRRKELEQEAK